VARKIEWAEQALFHLEYIAAFIAKDSPRYAALSIARIIERIEQAAEFPESGRRVREYPEFELRELF
jgi:plasmid stabilization system protein ParE